MNRMRRDDIESKKAKLEELRRLRAERQKEQARRDQQPTPSSATSTRREVDEILRDITSIRDGPSRASSDRFRDREDSFVGSGTPLLHESSIGARTPLTDTGTPPVQYAHLHGGVNVASASAGPGGSGRVSRASITGSDDVSFERHGLGIGVGGDRYLPDMVEHDQELFEIPQKERVVYNKEVQTTAFSSDDEYTPGHRVNGVGGEVGHEAKPPKGELTAEERDRAIEEESIKLDKEIEEEIREMSEEERTSIFTLPEFMSFLDHSSKILQRALSDNYDYTRDYGTSVESGINDSEGKRLKSVCTFWHEKTCKNRSITDIDWSPKYPELSVAAYNKNSTVSSEPDGTVAVWNLHMLDRPEFVFHSQSDVLSVTFSPFHANLVFGGTYAGQILLWDTRAKQLPVLKTPLSAAGHTHPVYAMKMVGTQNAHNLITSSTDGLVCSWLVDMLAQPQETLELIHAGHSKTNEVAITSLDFPDNETTTFWVGTEEGNLYQANRYDRAGSKAGLNPYDVYRGHAGAITGIDFHPSTGPIDFGDLILTSSVDWTIKLWRAKSLQKQSTTPSVVNPLYSFEESDDYVYDVRWHPTHPAVFASVNGVGRMDVWNLNIDTEVPVASTSIGTPPRALNKLKWDRKDGRRCAVGSSDGKMYIYDIGDMALPRESEWTELQRTVAGLNPAGAVSQMVIDGFIVGSGVVGMSAGATGQTDFSRSVYR